MLDVSWAAGGGRVRGSSAVAAEQGGRAKARERDRATTTHPRAAPLMTLSATACVMWCMSTGSPFRSAALSLFEIGSIIEWMTWPQDSRLRGAGRDRGGWRRWVSFWCGGSERCRRCYAQLHAL